MQTVEEKGFISLQQLADELRASESTIRRDLEHLDGIGQLRRTRGGAMALESRIEMTAGNGRPSSQKPRIAQFIAESVESDDTILLDGGTTTLEVARQLARSDKSVQVVTNSLPIAHLLANESHIELILLGGVVFPKTQVMLGPTLVKSLEGVHATRLVMGTGGVTEAGLFNHNSLLVEAERKMMESAGEVILACDSSKFGRLALCHLCPLTAIGRLVTDAGITPAWKQIIESAGVALDVVETQ